MSLGGQGHAGFRLGESQLPYALFTFLHQKLEHLCGIRNLSSSSDSVPETWAFLNPRTLSPVLILATSEERAASLSSSPHASWKRPSV